MTTSVQQLTLVKKQPPDMHKDIDHLLEARNYCDIAALPQLSASKKNTLLRTHQVLTEINVAVSVQATRRGQSVLAG